MKKWLIVLWLILMAFIQLHYFPKLGVEKGASVALSAAMLIMAFPSSILVFILGALIVKVLGVSSAPGSFVDVMVMQIFVVIMIAGSLYWLHRFLFPPLSV